MSDPEETKMNTEEEINENSGESDYLSSDDEEMEFREIVLALPALSLCGSPIVDEATRQKAIAAAGLLIAAAQEALVTKTAQGVGGSGETSKKKKARRPRTVNLDILADVAGASGSKATVPAGEEEPTKKPRKKGSSKLINPPDGPPKCNICGKTFLSWKAVFGNLRAHKDRGYHGFSPPPTFNAAVAASSGVRGSGLGTGGLQFDLNVDPIDDEEETILKFDLNRSPPQDDEEEGKKDKAD